MSAPKSKAEIGLYITPEVFQLPYSFITRGVLAEIHQLSKRDGVCTASDAHFEERFDVSRDTVSRAIQQLVGDGHLGRDYDTSGRLKRLLWPAEPAADYPQNQAGQDGDDHPQNQADTTRKIRRGPPAKSGTNKEGEVRREIRTPPYPRAASRRVGGSGFQSEEGEHDGQHDAGGRGAAPASSTSSRSTTPPPATRGAGASSTAGSGTTRNGAAGQGEPAGWVEFWEAWPTKQRRKDAAAAFSALSADDQQQAAERAARWLTQHPRQVARGAAPHPATWLKGEQWNDGPEPPDRSPKPGQPPAPPTHAKTTRRLNTDDLK